MHGFTTLVRAIGWNLMRKFRQFRLKIIVVTARKYILGRDNISAV